MSELKCRFCSSSLHESLADLGMAPLSNAYLDAADLQCSETFYPLHAFVCSKCRLAQLPALETPENIFNDYAYFSSYSDSWLEHCRKYVEQICAQRSLGAHSRVIELASNDGYLLQYFKQRGIPILGVEPAANVAAEAERKGVSTLVRFFGTETAKEMLATGMCADLLVANNVLAHVPDLNDFVEGIRMVLKPEGIATLEFPHLQNLLEKRQFDTIYHEHFSYFSFLTARRIFSAHGLRIFHVEELPTHGGSLRIHVCHTGSSEKETAEVAKLVQRETALGYDSPEPYALFHEQVQKVKRDLLRFLIDAREAGKTVAGYGAPAKGNTLLNYCGIREDLLAFTVDISPHKAGRFLPGTHIPIYAPDRIREVKPDYVLILPWNLKDEIVRQMADIRSWGGRFVVPIPEVEIV
ncbi:MAG TPA: class I SAM-dependent methyltransferase [Pontiellaceae bacterium]|nr:class I SAM-dependent methyltransferase [Pontiellaceae bacterium]